MTSGSLHSVGHIKDHILHIVWFIYFFPDARMQSRTKLSSTTASSHSFRKSPWSSSARRFDLLSLQCFIPHFFRCLWLYSTEGWLVKELRVASYVFICFGVIGVKGQWCHCILMPVISALSVYLSLYSFLCLSFLYCLLACSYFFFSSDRNKPWPGGNCPYLPFAYWPPSPFQLTFQLVKHKKHSSC